MDSRSLSLVACILGVTATAHAQPGATQPAGTEAAPVAESAEPDVPSGILEDANSGRVWVMPTALLPPQGTWSLNNYEIVFVGGSYALTDNFQLSGAAMVPMDEGGPELALLSAKLGLLALERFHLAVQGSTLMEREGRIARIGRMGTLVGGVVSLCVDRDCHSLLNGYVGAGFSILGDESSVPLVLSASLVQRISPHIKLMLEVDSGLILNPLYEEDGGVMVDYGLRITSRSIGVDLGLLRPICAECGGHGEFPLGIPWLALSYRGI